MDKVELSPPKLGDFKILVPLKLGGLGGQFIFAFSNVQKSTYGHGTAVPLGVASNRYDLIHDLSASDLRHCAAIGSSSARLALFVVDFWLQAQKIADLCS